MRGELELPSGKVVGPRALPVVTSPLPSTDPNTHILYACDSCGISFLDANSLAQHVRIHTAQALVMFQTDADLPSAVWAGRGTGQPGRCCRPGSWFSVLSGRGRWAACPGRALPPTAPECPPSAGRSRHPPI